MLQCVTRFIQGSSEVRYLEQLEGQKAASAKDQKFLERFRELNAARAKRFSLTDLRIASLGYRLGAKDGGESPLASADPELLAELKHIAKKWKGRQIAFKEHPDLSEHDEKKLEDLAKYPKFLALLLKNPHLVDHFLKWSILNKLSPQVFVEFPALAKKIDHCLLKARIGAFGGHGLQTTTDKDVTILVEGKPVSVLDGTADVKFSSGLVMKVDAIFEAFKKKNLDEGFLTYFKEGVTHWDPNGVNKIDLSQKDWYKQLPMLAHLSLEEAQAKFGKNEKGEEKADGKNWIMTVVATRQTEQLDTYGAHSFFRLAIPREDGSYDYTYGWGKFTKVYPQSTLDNLSYLFQPKLGTIQYPDNNEKYTSRQKKEFHYVMKDGPGCLESLRKDIVNSRNDNLPFQILMGNCTDWLVKKIRKYVGDKESHLFDIDYIKLQPNGPMGLLMRILKRCSERVRSACLSALSLLLGGKKTLTLTKKDGTQKKFCPYDIALWRRENRHIPFHHPQNAFGSKETVKKVELSV